MIDLRFYWHNGYVIVENFITRRECHKLAGAAANYADGRRRNIYNLHSIEPEFKSLILNESVLSMAEQIQGRRVNPIASRFFFNPPGGVDRGYPPHQDKHGPGAPYGALLTCGLTLDDSDVETRALERRIDVAPAPGFEGSPTDAVD